MKQQHVTVVTGGGRGIGRSIALRMASETAVLVVGRTASDLISVCAEITEAGGKADYCVDDVADPLSGARAVAKAHANGWTVRNLVCNAGFAKGGAITQLDPGAWHAMFNVNVHGTFYFLQACLPDMVKQNGGSVSIISSVSGLTGFKYDSGYGATKAALNAIAQSLAAEYSKNNIAVVALCPGYVHSDMTERSIAGMMKHSGRTREQALERIAQQNIQGRILRPQEIAEAVAFVASGAALPFSGKPMMLHGATDARVLKLVNWIRKTAAPAQRLVIPVSGGSDSSLVFKLCTMAYPEKTLGVFVGKPEELRCRDYLESLGRIEYVTDFESFTGNAEVDRWARFLTLSIQVNGWLVGCRNHTEDLVGLYSMASRAATYLPLINVWKSDVMDLCAAVGIPSEITDSSRRADPNCGRPEELAEIPLELIDTYMRVHTGELPESALTVMTEAQREYLAEVVAANSFKRFLPTPGPRLDV